MQLGDNLIFEENVSCNYGDAISLSSDGTIIAISAPLYNSSRGYVLLYKYNDVSWVQLGNGIIGEAGNDNSGKSLSLSDN